MSERIAYLKYSKYLYNEGCKYLDRVPPSDRDCNCCNYQGEPICSECLTCFSPCGFILDILCFPIRVIYNCRKSTNVTDAVKTSPNENV